MHHKNGMQTALRMARRATLHQEVPVGAALYYGEKKIAQAHNQCLRWKTPLAHAEILVIIRGQKTLQTPFLTGCTLYVTLEPCVFCCGAIQHTRIQQVIFGAYQHNNTMCHSPPYWGGFYEEECAMLLEDFFHCRRR